MSQEKSLSTPSDLPPYEPPQTGLLSYLPARCLPYVELMRVWPPYGVLHIYSPWLFGSLFAAAISDPRPSWDTILKTDLVLLLATTFLAGGAMSFNDFADRDIDGKIFRSRHRPVARGAVSPRNCLIFVAAQAIVWLAVLAQLSVHCLYYAIPSISLTVAYSYSKRITVYTPVVLGFTLGAGVFMGSTVMDKDPLRLVLDDNMNEAWALLCTYLSCVVWTIIYETIYAHQDVEDDEKEGVNSLAVRLKGRAKPVFYMLALLQVALLSSAGLLMRAGSMYFTSIWLGVGTSLGLMIWRVDLKEPSSCWWFFCNTIWFAGGSMALALLSQV